MLSKKYVLIKCLMAFLAVVVMVTSFNVALAAEKTAEWNVDKIGVLKVPQNWKAVKFEDVFDKVEKNLQDAVDTTKVKAVADNLQTISLAKKFLYEFLREENINIYQVTMNDDKYYYTSLVLLHKNHRPMTPYEFLFFDKDAFDENRQNFAVHFADIPAKVVSELSSSLSTAGKKPNDDIEVKILEQEPTKISIIQKAPAYSTELRLLSHPYGLTAANFVKAYVFSLDGHMTYAFLLTEDSQRDFWSPVFSSVVESVKQK